MSDCSFRWIPRAAALISITLAGWCGQIQAQIVREVATISVSDTGEEELERAEEEAEVVPDADDLDQLLELAETDLDLLTRVTVSAPALQLEVSTVSRQKSTVGKSPAAVFVITPEMIRRSGVTSIPEALRLAPGVQVARLDASKWAISMALID